MEPPISGALDQVADDGISKRKIRRSRQLNRRFLRDDGSGRNGLSDGGKSVRSPAFGTKNSYQLHVHPSYYVIYGLPRLRKRDIQLKGDGLLSYIRLLCWNFVESEP